MEQNNQGLQANSEYVINNLVQENANLSRENAMLKAIIQEQNEKLQSGNKEETE